MEIISRKEFHFISKWTRRNVNFTAEVHCFNVVNMYSRRFYPKGRSSVRMTTIKTSISFLHTQITGKNCGTECRVETQSAVFLFTNFHVSGCPTI